MKKTSNYRCIQPDAITADTMAVVEQMFEDVDSKLRAICEDMQPTNVKDNGGREAQMAFRALEDACMYFKKSMCCAQQCRDTMDTQNAMSAENGSAAA